MTDSIDTKMSQLQDLVDNLNPEADHATEQIRKYQTRLNDINSGILAHVPLTEEPIEDANGQWKYFLGYDRVAPAKWGFIVFMALTDDGKIINRYPSKALLIAKRRLRILAVPRIPDLLDEMIRQATALVEQLPEDTLCECDPTVPDVIERNKTEPSNQGGAR